MGLYLWFAEILYGLNLFANQQYSERENQATASRSSGSADVENLSAVEEKYEEYEERVTVDFVGGDPNLQVGPQNAARDLWQDASRAHTRNARPVRGDKPQAQLYKLNNDA